MKVRAHPLIVAAALGLLGPTALASEGIPLAFSEDGQIEDDAAVRSEAPRMQREDSDDEAR